VAFSFKKLAIPDIVLISPDVYKDERGFFLESYKKSVFKNNGIVIDFVQTNHSKSQKNVLRGLHYQLNPMAQAKLIRVVSGEIFDVAVDLRKGSPYYGKWIGEALSPENKNLLYIPEGFAHGFCTLSELAEVIYYCSNEYAPDFDRGIVFNDPEIGIDWPIKNPILSEKDLKLSKFDEAEKNFEYKK
jgi:dTDP-4-dehydrorhamnose 3,5-epimerase